MKHLCWFRYVSGSPQHVSSPRMPQHKSRGVVAMSAQAEADRTFHMVSILRSLVHRRFTRPAWSSPRSKTGHKHATLLLDVVTFCMVVILLCANP
eukprot:6186344-Pleurochrysis_carterae.AAC.2